MDLPLSAGTEGCVYPIPEGSTIVHKAGITTVYGPERNVLLSIEDSESGIVSTPAGPARATHVHQVPSDSIVKNVDERTTEVIYDGKVILRVINENEIRETGMIEHEWLEYAMHPRPESGTSYLSVTEFTAYWEVPPRPPYYGDARDFLFPAIQDNYHYYPKTIIQPVLEWNQGGSGCWTVSSWTGKDGSADPGDEEYYRSDPQYAEEGDTIMGVMQVSADGWDITTGNLNTGEYTSVRGQLDTTDNLWIFVALEGYHIRDNGDVPGDTTFHDIVVKDGYGRDITGDILWYERYDPEAQSILSDLKVWCYSGPYDDYLPRTIILETAN